MKKAVASSIVAVMLTSNLTPTSAKVDDVSQGVPKDEVKIELYQENIPEENKEESVTEEAIIESEEEAVTEEVKTKEVAKVEEKEATPEPANVTNEFDVDNFTDLQTALNKEGAIINLIGNIDVTEKLNVNAKNVTINGGNYSLHLNESNVTNLFMVRGSGLQITDLTIDGYTSSGMYILGAKDIVLKNVSFIGKDNNSSLVGIDADSATITTENVSTKNHKYSGIRVRKNSTVTSKGGNTHTNDYKQIECLEDGGSNTVINDNNDTVQYTVVDTTIVNGVRKVYYALAHSIKVTNYQELKDAITNANSIISIESDITLEGDLTIKEDKVVINGNDYTINCNGDYKLTISSINASIDRLNFENYISVGLSVYNATKAKLTAVRFFGNPKSNGYDTRSKVGLDISNSTVEIGGIQTENHLWRGIQARNGSKVTITSRNTHYGDVSHLQILHGGSNSGSISTIVDTNKYYTVENPYVDGNGDTIINHYDQSFYNKPVFNGVDDKEIQLGESFDPLDGVTVSDIEDVTIDPSKIKVTGDVVDPNKPGKYKLVYEVEDYDGNVVKVERTIAVKPNYDVDDDNMVDTDKLPSTPNYDVEDDMGVNTPSKPNYDVEDDMGVNTPSTPNYDVDDDMGVNTPSTPNYDVDDDMGVNTPSTPNYDVDDDMGVNTPSTPNYDVDDDMGVNTPSTPNYDVDDNMGVNTPNYDVEDDMEVDTDKDQVVEDKPTTLPDDIPVQDGDNSGDGNLPGDGEEETLESTGGTINKPTANEQEAIETLPQTSEVLNRVLTALGILLILSAGLLLMKRPKSE